MYGFAALIELHVTLEKFGLNEIVGLLPLASQLSKLYKYSGDSLSLVFTVSRVNKLAQSHRGIWIKRQSISDHFQLTNNFIGWEKWGFGN